MRARAAGRRSPRGGRPRRAPRARARSRPRPGPPLAPERLRPLRAALRQRPGVGRRRWRCHVLVAARAAAAATATVAQEVAEEVGLALKPDPDPVPCTRVGESPTGLERSSDREASTGEGGWGPGSESGAAPGVLGAVVGLPSHLSNRCDGDCCPGRGGLGLGGRCLFRELRVWLGQVGARVLVERGSEQVERTRAWSRESLGMRVRGPAVGVREQGLRWKLTLRSAGFSVEDRDRCSVSAAIGFERAQMPRPPFHPFLSEVHPAAVGSRLRTCSCSEDLIPH